jgi:hypothetical protein
MPPFIVKGKWIFSLICVAALLFPIFPVQGQFESVGIAKTYVIDDPNALFGDIVSFDRETQTMRLSQISGDPELFGVIADEPLLVLETENGGVPVLRNGDTLINVTTRNGAIRAGDYITSSPIPGKGMRADQNHTHIVGIALEPWSGGEVATTTIEDVIVGVIPVLLSVGTQEKAADLLEEYKEEEPPAQTGITEATILNIIQYLLAAFIAVGSVYIAFKNFGPNIKDGIVSIGRNPLAKSSIRSMVVLNVVLIAVVSLGGLFISLAILLLPI